MTNEFIKVLFAMVNFLIIYLIAKKYFFKTVTEKIDNRNREIRENYKVADDNKRNAEELKKQMEEEILKSREESKKILEEYKISAEKLYSEILEEAKKESELVRERSKKEIEREKQKAQSEVRQEVADLSILISKKILEKELDEKEHRRLINDFISKVGT